MLVHLSIQNYALIEDLEVQFKSGLTTITGETGAGKSILLGALSLVLGNRADTTVLRNPNKKCIVEAEFEIEAYNLKSIFDSVGLEYFPRTILRREIHTGGRSRAFVNDTPVTLDIMNELGQRLIDIHSQHHTLKLTDGEFQMKVVDALAGNAMLLAAYRKAYSEFKDTSKMLNELNENRQAAVKELDYNSFLLKELEEANLPGVSLEELEEEQEELGNVETILATLAQGNEIFQNESSGVLSVLGELKSLSARLSAFGPRYEDLYKRIDSAYIELDDIQSEWSEAADQVEHNPERLEVVAQKLEVIYSLQKKHGLSEINELLELRDSLSARVLDTADMEERIADLEDKLTLLQEEVEMLAEKLREKRIAVIPDLEVDMVSKLQNLGIPNADVQLNLLELEKPGPLGADELQFLFRANKGTEFETIKKVASGGELSRIMLTIKSILVAYEPLPTMIFDEIDSGVSGEISIQMGEMMKRMSDGMQILSITHLPQVASKGDHHFKVYKEDSDGLTRTLMKELNLDDRIMEIAEMLDGKSMSESALAHARQLLN